MLVSSCLILSCPVLSYLGMFCYLACNSGLVDGKNLSYSGLTIPTCFKFLVPRATGVVCKHRRDRVLVRVIREKKAIWRLGSGE